MLVEAFAQSLQQTSFEVVVGEQVGSYWDPSLPRHQNLIEACGTTMGAPKEVLVHDVAGLSSPRSSLSVLLTRRG